MSHGHVILIADDDTSNLEAATDVCMALGFKVHCVECQDDLLAALEEGHFCGCMLDLEFKRTKTSPPKIQVGWATLERIQAVRKPEDFPVVIMTAHGEDHRYPANAALNQAAFVKKPFDVPSEVPGEIPVEEVLRRLMRRSCEAKFKERCPNFDFVPGKSDKKKRTAREARIYRGPEVRIWLDGRIEDRLVKILVNEQEKWIRVSTFEVLYQLAVALRQTETETLCGLDLGGDYNKKLSMARKDLVEKAGLDRALFENDGNKGYRLSIPPENVGCDAKAVGTFHKVLFRAHPWA